MVTSTTLDDLNRVSQVSMVNGAQSMTVDYAYYATGLVQSITYSNGTHILYEYDAAGRVSRMLEEKTDSSQWFRNITYEYADNDWLLRILEKWPGGTGGFLNGSSELEAQAAPEPPGNGAHYDINFTYDNRGRLIKEVRSGAIGTFWIAWLFYDLTKVASRVNWAASTVRNIAEPCLVVYIPIAV